MPKITFIEFNGTPHTLDVAEGQTLMRIALDNCVPGIVADCGGSCSCATCHAYVDPAWEDKVPAPNETEQSMLECVLDGAENSRLTCQIKLSAALDGLVVRLPKSQF